jgi:hypothetical protein
MPCLHSIGIHNNSTYIYQFAADDVELTRMNGPKDKVFEWFIGPLLIMKEQIKNLEMKESEETCLKELVMRCKNDIPEDWDSTGFPSNDNVRRAQLQAIIRRYEYGVCK